MPSETVRGIVIRAANYRDNDRMLTLLTPDQGRLDVLARGCRRPKNPLLPASELFVHGEYVLFRTGDKRTVNTCELLDTFYPLRLDAYRLTCGSYLLALGQAAALPGEEAAGLYSLLLQGLYRLSYAREENPLGEVSTFLLLYAVLLGYKPRLNHCAHCRAPLDTSGGAMLDMLAGGLCCQTHASGACFRISCAQVEWLREVMRDGWPKQQSGEAPLLFECLRRYVESRLETTIKASRLLP